MMMSGVQRLRAMPLRMLMPRFLGSKVEHLASMLPAESVLRDPELLDAFHRDWLGFRLDDDAQRLPRLVMQPGNTEEVSTILSFCNSHGIAVVPQGGNTGLVRGGVPTRGDEIVLSTRRLNKVREVDPMKKIVVCEAGAIIDKCSETLKKEKLMMPIDLGSSGSCTVGGVLSTNAGGVRVFRYGSLRANLLGLEVVTADGTILDMLTTVRKDNTGYDIKQLFVGSEGTLGVITAAALSTPDLPNSTNVALLVLDSYNDVITTLQDARNQLGEILSAAECWDQASMKLVNKHFPEIPDPRKAMPTTDNNNRAQFFLLVETQGADSTHDLEKLFNFVSNRQGMLAQSNKEAKQLWALRENITLALKKNKGVTYKFDVSLPIDQIHNATEQVKQALEKQQQNNNISVLQYGHIYEGGLHLNVWVEKHNTAVKNIVEKTIYDICQRQRGSISAEHGIGTIKKQLLQDTKQAQVLQVMKNIKRTMDKNNILNPGKIF